MGDYCIVDPISTLTARVVGRPVPTPQPSYPDRLPISQPEEFDNTVTVYALRDGVPVLQGASLAMPKVGPDLKQGEDFEATYQMVGLDGRRYWVSTRRARVPVEGTHSPDWDALAGVTPAPQPESPVDIAALTKEVATLSEQTATLIDIVARIEALV
ncbi:MAG: hypothetical protein IT304_08990 [Dehalococcoidia bacterium]|nr:hypothetical protein [Dehalococcoidia bacterium]